MKTIDFYVLKSFAAEDLDLMINRLSFMGINLNYLINGVPISAILKPGIVYTAIIDKIVKYHPQVNDIVLLDASISINDYVRVNYSYTTEDGRTKTDCVNYTINEAEEVGIEIEYI